LTSKLDSERRLNNHRRKEKRAHSLDISQNQTAIKYRNSPALGTGSGTRDNANIGEGKCIGHGIVVISPHCKSTRHLVLYEHVALAVTIPVRKMNADSGAWNTKETRGAMLPVWRGVDVFINLGAVAVLINPLVDGHLVSGLLQSQIYMCSKTSDISSPIELEASVPVRENEIEVISTGRGEGGRIQYTTYNIVIAASTSHVAVENSISFGKGQL
jgi:hypothetical protein